MRRIFASIVALCLVSAGTSRATQVTQSMNVSLTIVGTPAGQVTLLVGPLVLTGDPTGQIGPWEGTATIHVTATAGLPYVITLNEGLHRPGLVYPRRIQSGVDSRAYAIFSDPTLFQLWGNGDPILGFGVSGVGTGGDQAYTAWATTYAGDPLPIPSGTYTDVVTVAVDF